MRMFRMLAALVLALLPLAGCASGARGPGGQDLTTVVVENNLAPPAPVTVYAVSTVGDRERVGIVAPGTTRSLRFRSGAVAGQYRLIAQVSGTQQLVSQPIPLTGGDTVRWTLFSNTVSVQ